MWYRSTFDFPSGVQFYWEAPDSPNIPIYWGIPTRVEFHKPISVDGCFDVFVEINEDEWMCLTNGGESDQ